MNERRIDLLSPPRPLPGRRCLRGAAFAALLLFAGRPPLRAQAAATAPAPGEAIVDAMSAHEKQLWTRMREMTPRVETYMQNSRQDAALGATPVADRYYLGALEFHGGFHLLSFLPDPAPTWRRAFGPLDDTLASPARKLLGLDLDQDSFVGMLFPGGEQFDRKHYRFEYVRREFLGEVRCYVFDVAPLDVHDRGDFWGRIWIEDQDDVLVRFSGSFWQNRFAHPDIHFDSWRVNLRPGVWLPTYIYCEETDLGFGLVRHAAYESETRLWGYDLHNAGRQEELATVSVEGADLHAAATPAAPSGPVTAERDWEHQAEDNVLDRLERAGLLAPAGPVEQVLQIVVNNLLYGNQLSISPPVRCRILLTTPIDSLAIGHTIVLSRGLVDSVPDEASLAAMLAHELAHISLGQRLDTQYAFGDRMLFSDEQVYSLLHLRRTADEEARANQLAVQLLSNSVYKDQLATTGLYLKQLAVRRQAEPHLLSPHLGNDWFTHDYLDRLHSLLAAAPPLAPRDVHQLAALPLAGRLQVDAWDGRLSLPTATTVPLLSAREKMPLQITPEFPYLQRQPTAESKSDQPAGPH